MRRLGRLDVGLLRLGPAKAKSTIGPPDADSRVGSASGEAHGIYGSAKIAQELAERDDLETDCRNTVSQAMRELGLASRVSKAFTPTTTKADPTREPAPNALDRDFRAEAPSDRIVDATLLALPPVVADMVRVQRLTSPRPGEICSMAPADIDRSGDVWVYSPADHKTEHFEKDRVIAIGCGLTRTLSNPHPPRKRWAELSEAG